MTNVIGMHQQGQKEYVFRRQCLQRLCHNLLTTQESVLPFNGFRTEYFILLLRTEGDRKAFSGTRVSKKSCNIKLNVLWSVVSERWFLVFRVCELCLQRLFGYLGPEMGLSQKLFLHRTIRILKQKQAIYVEPNAEARSFNHCFCGKLTRITYSECVFSFKYPTCNAHVPHYHLWPVQLYNISPHYLINSAIIGKKQVIEHKMCVLISLQILFEPLLILRRLEQDRIKMVIGIHVKNTLFLSDFNETWIFSTDFRKIPKYKIL